MEFISEFQPPLLMQSTSTVLVTGYSTSIQAAASVKEIRMFFGTMTSVWKLFYYSSHKAGTLKGIQDILGFPELKIVKPSATRWLSQECYVKGVVTHFLFYIITTHIHYLFQI